GHRRRRPGAARGQAARGEGGAEQQLRLRRDQRQPGDEGGVSLPPKRLLLIFLPGIAILAAGIAFWLLWAGPGPAAQPKTIIVAQGSSLARVADQLEQAGAIRGGAGTYRMFARLFGSSDPVQAGEFLIPARLSADGILNLLQHGRPVLRLVTIPEGMPSVLVQERLMAIPFLTGAVGIPEEGSVLPNSYSFRRG